MKFVPKQIVAIADHLGWRLEENPVTGSRRLPLHSNDVMAVVERLGGVGEAAHTLGVEPIEVEHWIDDHYVPCRYANEIKRRTGWSLWSIQIPPFDPDAARESA